VIRHIHQLIDGRVTFGALADRIAKVTQRKLARRSVRKLRAMIRNLEKEIRK
jgi:hypothetical protein